MAGFQLSWTIEGETQLSRRLEGLAADIRDLRQPFKSSVYVLTQFFSGEVFSSQGAALGKPWKPLKSATLADKLRHGFSSEPLTRTGAMQRGFRSIVSSDQAVIYNTSPYFKYHQSNQPRRRLPRRVMMAFTEGKKQEIVKIFQEYIQEQVRKGV